jgi:hypothetical protein
MLRRSLAIFRSAGPEGRSPMKKNPQPTEGQSRFRASGGKAAKIASKNLCRCQ